MMTQATDAKAPRKRKEPSASIDLDAIAKLLDLPEWDEIDELNRDYYADCSASACEGDPESDEEQERAMAAERAAQDEVFSSWRGAILHAATTLLGEHGLELQEVLPKNAPRGALTWDFRIVPKESWLDAANKIRETVNGVGYFHFSTLREFLDSGPYTARRAVLAHLGYVRRYPEVYGTASARSLYERGWS